MSEPEGPGLDEVLEGLRAELASARQKAARQPVQFPIQSLTVELKVGVTRSRDGKAVEDPDPGVNRCPASAACARRSPSI